MDNLNIRLNEEDMNRLNAISERFGWSKSRVVRWFIKVVYEFLFMVI